MANLPENQTYIKSSNVPNIPTGKSAFSTYKPVMSADRYKTLMAEVNASRDALAAGPSTPSAPSAPGADLMNYTLAPDNTSPTTPVSKILGDSASNLVRPLSESGYQASWEGAEPSQAALIKRFAGVGEYINDPSQNGTIIRSARPDQNDYTFERMKQAALDGRSNRLFEVDHGIPLWLGGTNTVENLVVLSRPEHAEKTKAEAVALTLLSNGVIDRDEAFYLATTWKNRDLRDVPSPRAQIEDVAISPGQTRGQIPLADAIRIRDQWKAAEKTVPKTTFKDFWKEFTTNPFAYGFVKGLTAGAVKDNPNVRIDDGGDQAAAIAGQLIGTVASVSAIGRIFAGIGAGAKMIRGTQAAQGTLQKMGIVKSGADATTAANTAAKVTMFKPNIGITMREAMRQAQMKSFVKWTPPVVAYGQIQETFEEDPARLSRVVEDVIYGGLTGFFSPGIKGAAKTASSVAAISMIMDKFNGRDENLVQNALINGLTLGTLHHFASKDVQRQATEMFNKQASAAAHNVLSLYVPSLKNKHIDVESPTFEVPKYTPQQIDSLEQEIADSFIKRVKGEGDPISEEALIGQSQAIDNAIFVLRQNALGEQADELTAAKLKEFVEYSQRATKEGKSIDDIIATEKFFGGIISPQAPKIGSMMPEDLRDVGIPYTPSAEFPSGSMRSTGLAKGYTPDPEGVAEFIAASKSGNAFKTVAIVQRPERAPLVDFLNRTTDYTDDAPEKILQVVGYIKQADGSTKAVSLGYWPQAKRIGDPKDPNIRPDAINAQREIKEGRYEPYSTELNKNTVYDAMDQNGITYLYGTFKNADYEGSMRGAPNKDFPFVEFSIGDANWKRSIAWQKGEGHIPLTVSEDGADAVLRKANTTTNKDAEKEAIDEYVRNIDQSADQSFDLKNPVIQSFNTGGLSLLKSHLRLADEVFSAPDHATLAQQLKRSFDVTIDQAKAQQLFTNKESLTVQDLFELIDTNGSPLSKLMLNEIKRDYVAISKSNEWELSKVFDRMRLLSKQKATTLTENEVRVAPTLQDVTVTPAQETVDVLPGQASQSTVPETQAVAGLTQRENAIPAAPIQGTLIPENVVAQSTPVQGNAKIDSRSIFDRAHDEVMREKGFDPAAPRTREYVMSSPTYDEVSAKVAEIRSRETAATPRTPEGNISVEPITAPNASPSSLRTVDITPPKESVAPAEGIENAAVEKKKPKNASWSNFVKTERKKEGTNAMVYNLTDDPDIHQYFTRTNLTRIAKETAQNAGGIEGGFAQYLDDITRKLRPALGDSFTISSPKELRQLRASYMRMARSKERQQISVGVDGSVKVDRGPIDIMGEADQRTLAYNRANGLSDDAMSIAHIDPNYRKGAVDSRESFEQLMRKISDTTGGKYIPIGLTGKGINNTVAIKYEPRLVEVFNKQPTKYLNAGEDNLSDQAKFLRVYLTDVLGLPKNIEAADVVKRSNLLFNRYDQYSGANPERAVSLRILKSPSIKEAKTAEEINTSSFIPGAEDSSTRAIESLRSGSVVDGKLIIGEGLFPDLIKGMAYDPRKHRSGMKITISAGDDGKILHKGHAIKVDPAIKQWLNEEYGTEVGPFDIISFDTNAKLGPKDGEVTIQTKNIYGKSLAAAESGTLNRSIEDKFLPTDEGVTQDMVERTQRNITALNDFTKAMEATNSKEELLDLVTQYADRFGLDVDNVFESNLSEAFQLGAAKINLSRQMERLSKNLFFDTVLNVQAPETGRVFHSFPVKLKLDGPDAPARYPNDKELVVGDEFMKANNLKEGDEVLAYRNPLTDISNIVVAKVVNGSKLGNTSLTREHAYMSPFNERIRQQADQDGDMLHILKVGENGIPQSYLDAVKKRGFKAIPFTEVNKIEGGTGFATPESIANVIKNQLVGDDQTGIIATQSRIMEMVTSNNASFTFEKSVKEGGKTVTPYKVTVNGTVVDSGFIPKTNNATFTIKPKWGDTERQIRTQALQEALDSKKSIDIIKRTENNNPNWITKQLFADSEGGEINNVQAAFLKSALKKFQAPMELRKRQNDFENLQQVQDYLKESLDVFKRIKTAGGELTPYQEKLLSIGDIKPFVVPQATKLAADRAGKQAVESAFEKPSTAQADEPGLYAVRRKFLAMRKNYFAIGNDPQRNEKRRALRQDFLDWFHEEMENGKFTSKDRRAIAYWAATTKEANLVFTRPNQEPSFVFRLLELVNVDPAVARTYYKASEAVDARQTSVPTAPVEAKQPVERKEVTVGKPAAKTVAAAKDGQGFVGNVWQNIKNSLSNKVVYEKKKNNVAPADIQLLKASSPNPTAKDSLPLASDGALKPPTPHKLPETYPVLEGDWKGTNYDPMVRHQNRMDATEENLGYGAASMPVRNNMLAVPRKPGSDEAMIRLGTVLKHPETGEHYLVADLMNRRFDGLRKIDFAIPNSGDTPIPKYNQNFSGWKVIREGKGREDARNFVESGEWQRLLNALQR